MIRLALALLLLLPAAADAATVTLKLGRPGPAIGGTPRFTAAPGEANRVTVTETKAGDIVFRDAGAILRAGGDCRQIDAHAARCPSTDSLAKVKLGDGDDRLRQRSGLFPEIFGGAGNDVIRGSRRIDFLDGGPGNDTIRGGNGSDTLTGGEGRDRLFGGRDDDRFEEDEQRPARDVIAGGPSEFGDEVDYSARSADLRVDLAKGTTSTEDELGGLEDLRGGSGDDRLTGDDDRNRLIGGDGDDVLTGGAGDDRLEGEAGADTYECGAGDESVQTETDDTVAGCETLDALEGDLRFGIVPLIDADSADFTVDCGSLGCEFSVTLPSGAASFAFGEGQHVASVPLTAPVGDPLTVRIDAGRVGYQLKRS